MKRITIRLALASLLAASIAGAALQSAQAGGASTTPGNVWPVVTDCHNGPWFMGESLTAAGEGPFIPTVVKNQNCIAVAAFINETLTNGTLSVTLPKGLTVTKKIAAPTSIYFGDMSGCTWGGSWSLQSAGTAQTLKLSGITCSMGGYLGAFFTATVKNPTTMSYKPYNIANADYARGIVCAGGGYGSGLYDAISWVFNGNPYFFNSGYHVTGQFTKSKGASTQATYDSYFGIAQDADYYAWLYDLWRAYYSGYGCLG